MPKDGRFDLKGEDDSPSAATGSVPIGAAWDVHQLRQIIEPFAGECPIRYDNKGPIEIFYNIDKAGAVLILR